MIPTPKHSNQISNFLPLDQTKSANASAREKKSMQLSKTMKIAIEGAERVIDRLALMFQDANISCRRDRLPKRATTSSVGEKYDHVLTITHQRIPIEI